MNADSHGNPLLDQYSDEGFIDCVLRIADRSETTDHYRLRLQASHAGQIVGMGVDIVKNIQGGFDAEMNLQKAHVYRQGVVFYRTGPESDRLVTALATHQGALDMQREAVKIKIFGRDAEPFDADDYYESFFNLDLKNGLVFWNEKDQDYRVPLIRALTE